MLQSTQEDVTTPKLCHPLEAVNVTKSAITPLFVAITSFRVEDHNVRKYKLEAEHVRKFQS